MAGLPQNFSAISSVLGNYDFVDIASGTGYITFYAGCTVDLKLLSNYTYYTDVMGYGGTHTGDTAYALLFDHDYDVLLNRPMDLKGYGLVNVPIYSNNSHAPPDTTHSYVSVSLSKWDGTTETLIVSNDSRVQSVTGSTNVFTMLAVDLIVPLTHFKIGETIRLTIKLYTRTTDLAADARAGYAADPMNRTTGWDSTGVVPSRLTFLCPVRLNL